MDERQFFNRIPQESHPTVEAHVGLGTKEEFDIRIKGFCNVIPLGDYETDRDGNAGGHRRAPSKGATSVIPA